MSTSAILLVGGMGTRLLPLTLKTPKPMLQVAGVGRSSATVSGAMSQWLLRDGLGMVGRILFSKFQGRVKSPPLPPPPLLIAHRFARLLPSGVPSHM